MKKTINTSDLSKWMTNLPKELHDRPLNKLAIPGSHDTSAYWLNLDLPVTPDNPPILQRLGKIRKVRQIIRQWSITQEHSLKEQLEKGIRYIDMRTVYYKEENDFFVFHGLYGYKSTFIFEQIRSFLDQHPKEVVFIDFNHLISFRRDLYARFSNLIVKYFGDKMIPKPIKGVDITLNDIWQSGKQVIAFYPLYSSQSKFWPNYSIESPWFNTTSLSKLMEGLNRLLVTSSKQKFTVFQGVLTPDTWTIVTRALSSLKKTFGLKTNESVCLWLDKLHKEKKHGINIVISDFIAYNDYPAHVVRMNDLLLY